MSSRRILLITVFAWLFISACSLAAFSNATSTPAAPTLNIDTQIATISQGLMTPAVQATPAFPPTVTLAAAATPNVVTATPRPQATPAANPLRFARGEALTLDSIHMLQTVDGWATGHTQTNPDQHILRTSNGGQSWKDVTPPELLAPSGSGNRRQAAGYFASALDAWVVYDVPIGGASATVWQTHDGGLTWQASAPLPQPEIMDFFDPGEIFLVDGQNMYLMAHNGVGMNHDYVTIYRSTDGGMNWTRVVTPPDGGSFPMSCYKNGMAFSTDLRGRASGDCHGVSDDIMLYLTVDGGLNWTTDRLPAPTDKVTLFTGGKDMCGTQIAAWFGPSGLVLLNCRNDQPLYRSWLYHIDDQQQTITNHPLPVQPVAWQFLNLQQGWIIGGETLYHTADGGLTWKAVQTVHWGGQLNFVSADVGWVLARSGEDVALVKTENGGVLWKEIKPVVGE